MAEIVKKYSTYWPSVLLLIVSIGLALGALEYVARSLQPLDLYEIAPDESDAESIHLRHPTRGHSLRPNFHGHFIHPDFGGEKVSTNSLGFRDREQSSRKGVNALNVTVLGDSLTFGTGVKATETFCTLLEKRLAHSLERPVRVFNTGVPGYGALHELVVLQEEYARQLPDISVVAFYTGNDLNDVFRFYRQRGAIVDLLSHFPEATMQAKYPPTEDIIEINEESRFVLFAHPDAQIRFPIQPGWIRPGALLRFGAALKPESWNKPRADGVHFEIIVEQNGQAITLFDEYVDPNHQLALRGWNDRQVELSEIAESGSTLVFRTTSGPKGSYDYDWACWVAPHIFYPSMVNDLGGGRLQSQLLLQPYFKKYWEHATPAKTGVFSRTYWEKRSSLLRFVFGRWDNLAVRWRLKPPKAVFNYFMISSFDREMSEQVRTGLDLTMRALVEMQAFMRSRDGRVILLLIPTKLQAEPDTIRRFMKQSGLDPREFDFSRPHGMLNEFCRRSGIICVDLLPELRQRVAQGEQVYFPEGHLNRKGHRIAAARLATAVEKSLAIRTNGSP